MSYGDDADSPWDRGTRVEASKRWHEQNQLRHDYSYRSASKPKSTYKPDYSKTYYKPNYSNKTKQQHRRKQSRTTTYKPYNNQRNQKRQSYNVISVEEANERIKKQKKKSKSKNNGSSALSCIIAILAIFICLSLIGTYVNLDTNPLIFWFVIIFIGVPIFVLVDDSLNKDNSSKSSDKWKKSSKSSVRWKNCKRCKKKVNKVAKKCPYCGYEF